MRKLILPITMILLLLAGCGTTGTNTASGSNTTPNSNTASDLNAAPGSNTASSSDMASIVYQLELAIWEKDLVVVKRLLQEHKEVAKASNKNGETMLYVAASAGNTSVVELLLEHYGADVNAKNVSGTYIGFTALIEAVYRDRVEVIKLLLNRGADVNIKGWGNLTALHWVQSKQAAELLLAQGADIHAKTNTGTTPLQAAILLHSEMSELIKYLVASGARVNDRNSKNRTPLHLALDSRNPRQNVVEYLVAQGADVNAQDAEGLTPLHIAFVNGRPTSLVDFLISKGANPNARDARGRTAKENVEMEAEAAERTRREKAQRDAEAAASADYDRRMVEARKRTQEAGRAATEAYLARQNRQEASSNSQTDQLNDMRKRDDARRSRDAAGAVQQRNQESKRCYSAGNAICP